MSTVFDPNVPNIQKVYEKYTLGKLTTLSRDKAPGPLMDIKTFQQFVEADPTPDKQYLEWMIFQAGGGQAAVAKSNSMWFGQGPKDQNSMSAQCRLHFVALNTFLSIVTSKTKTLETDWRRDGDFYANAICDKLGVKASYEVKKDGSFKVKLKDREVHSSNLITGNEGESFQNYWDSTSEGRFEEFLRGDEDATVYGAFGFARSWPGPGGRYARIVNYIRLFHTGFDRLVAYNRNIHQKTPGYENLKPVGMKLYEGYEKKSFAQPKAVYADLHSFTESLQTLAKMAAEKDTRHVVVYDSPDLVAICPLTIGASMKYGFDKWCTANKTEFERAFDGTGSFTPNWTSNTKVSVLVYLRFKTLSVDPLTHIAVQIPNEYMRSMTQTNVNYFDMNNAQGAKLTWVGIVDALSGTAAEAEFKKCMRAITEWSRTFNRGEIHSSVHQSIDGFIEPASW
jgi:hypothetical protein